MGMALVTVSGAIGWYASSLIQPSDQETLDGEKRSLPITVPVESGVLTSTVVTRGRIEYSTTRSLQGSLWDGSLLPVITMAPEIGTEISAGDVIYELATRPTIALRGPYPLFRDLEPGDQGDDVQMVQKALAAIGIDPGPADGTFRRATQRAVDILYTERGYRPIGSTGEAKSLSEIILPMAEVAVFNQLPVIVITSRSVGEVVDSDVLTVAISGISVASSLTTAQRELVDVGDPVLIESTVLGLSMAGVVSQVADQPGGEGLDQNQYRLEIDPVDNVPDALVDADVRVTVEPESTPEAVLHVPFAAISSDADGRAWIAVLRDDVEVEIVYVETGLSAGGRVEILSNSGDLAAGDLVVVGEDID